MSRTVRAVLLLLLSTYGQCTEKYKVTDLVYFDVSIGGQVEGRIVIALFGEVVPKTVKNFKALASDGVKGRKYGNNTPFHRVIRNFMVQGGDVVSGDGLGIVSIFGKHFKDENFVVKHTAAGFVSMANSGPNSNGCQFFIITQPTPWLDGKHVVFGRVTEGMDIIHKIEGLKTYEDDRPVKNVYIVESGLLPLSEPFYVYDDANDLMAWAKASIFPLGMSFTILGIFHWFFKKLDVAAEGA
ncbi:uncharacterized protein LOC129000662 [Macrosteles quadrilineatus]|uniref:uncharacterized protein LOC129000662 n=1 Tax=Macrosteles quadrilineatus TaxID=74068 RepID=UPI0023E1EA21|nr:uncharacterized protein LOC129000662 [Macrosteles quadrilineatus]